MQIRCIAMHPVTLLAITIELILLGTQLTLLLNRPDDKPRLWYLLLLVWLIILNITSGMLPNPVYAMPIYIQNIIAYGIGFGLAAYFPFYFYKAFDLKGLRFHALYGVAFFFVLPYLFFFLISYSIHQDLEYAQRWGFIIPFIYSGVLLVAILKAIRTAYKENRDHNRYVEEIAVYCAVTPWSFMAVIVYFEWGKLAETLFTNLGFLAVTGLFVFRSVRKTRKEARLLAELELVAIDPEVVARNCKRFWLSVRETEIALLLCRRYKHREIAEKLFISERTADKHVEHIFTKTGVTSRAQLLERLNNE